MGPATITLGDASLGRALFAPICDLYDEVFSEPPFHWRDDESLLHRGRLIRMLDDSSFGVTVARVGDEVVGFAYGYTLRLDSRWWHGFTVPLPKDVTTERPGRTFVLHDYGVARKHRGRGVGRMLHHTLLGSRPEERATLATEPAATATKQIYEHWGWHHVGRAAGGPNSSAPWFDIYLRDSLDDLRHQYPTVSS